MKEIRKKGTLLFLTLLLLSLVTACSGVKKITGIKEPKQTESKKKKKDHISKKEQSSTQKLIAKYNDAEVYDVDPKIHEIREDEKISFKGKTKATWTSGIFDDYTKRPDDPDTILKGSVPFEIFSDLSLKNNLAGMAADFNRNTDTGEITIEPGNSGVELLLGGKDQSSEEKQKVPLFGEGSWGLMNRLYVVQYHNLSTGKLLDKPKLLTYQVIHDENRLKESHLTYEYRSNGILDLYWNKVENATKYYIINLSYRFFYQEEKNAWSAELDPYEVAMTTENQWDSSGDKDPTNINSEFVEDYQTEDEKYGDDSILNELDDEKPEKPRSISTIVVIASDGTNYSAISNGISVAELSENLPYKVAQHGEYDHEAYHRTMELRSVFEELNIDKQDEDTYSIRGIAVNGKGVCASYAASFAYLARKAGLEAVIVKGTINGDPKAGHAWNAVKLDGEWRYFDSTWNDDNPDPKMYFNLTSDDPVLTREHTTGDNYILPMNIENYQ